MKLAIQDSVKVPVKFSLNDNGKTVSQSFHLTCDRLMQDQVNSRTQNGEEKIDDFIRSVATGWSGQNLVLDDDNKPAEFSPVSLDMMLSITGVSQVIFKSYFREIGAKEKN